MHKIIISDKLNKSVKDLTNHYQALISKTA